MRDSERAFGGKDAIYARIDFYRLVQRFGQRLENSLERMVNFFTALQLNMQVHAGFYRQRLKELMKQCAVHVFNHRGRGYDVINQIGAA